jgi:hypothetical protein
LEVPSPTTKTGCFFHPPSKSLASLMHATALTALGLVKTSPEMHSTKFSINSEVQPSFSTQPVFRWQIPQVHPFYNWLASQQRLDTGNLTDSFVMLKMPKLLCAGIWDSHGSDYKDYCLLRCDTIHSGTCLLMFLWNIGNIYHSCIYSH